MLRCWIAVGSPLSGWSIKCAAMVVASDPLARIPFLLHFTDQRNLPRIQDCDGLFATATLRAAQIEFFRSEEHTSELQSRLHLVCRLLLEKKKKKITKK